MPRRLAQQRMTLSDLEWSFHVSRAIFAVAERLVVLAVIQWQQKSLSHRNNYSVSQLLFKQLCSNRHSH